jgi:hypothetical protein
MPFMQELISCRRPKAAARVSSSGGTCDRAPEALELHPVLGDRGQEGEGEAERMAAPHHLVRIGGSARGFLHRRKRLIPEHCHCRIVA